MHFLYQSASQRFNPCVARDITRYAKRLESQQFPVIFSLMHLSQITGIEYRVLHDSVNRKRESANYKLFAIRKKNGDRRFIHAVNGRLFHLQQYIHRYLLSKAIPHSSSFAYHSTGGILKCAQAHCGCNWLIKFDLNDFFFSIPENRVFEIFRRFGYNPLLSFELARLSTTLRLPHSKAGNLQYNAKWRPAQFCDPEHDGDQFPYHPTRFQGVLPQGAPTSPQLSNLIAFKMDVELNSLAQRLGLVYTRYADDIAFSSGTNSNFSRIGFIQKSIRQIIRNNQFLVNEAKTRVSGPGSRKVVLGFLVDGSHPRLTKAFRHKVDQQIFRIFKFGIADTAKSLGFTSTYGYRNHLRGLLSFVKSHDPQTWKSIVRKYPALPQLLTSF